MDNKKFETIMLLVLIAITGAVYLYTVAPTFSFWDCGEFIASSYTLAVPHPPGTPFYILIGRVWLMIMGLFAAVLPISREVGWHMNLLCVGFSVTSSALAYKMILKIFRIWRSDLEPKAIIIIAFAAALGLSFSFTFWQNAIETEVYSAATCIFFLLNYLTFLWYERLRQGEPRNRLLLLVLYLIFLFTGVQLMPFLYFVPLLIFIFVVERRYLKDRLFLLLGIFMILLFAVTFIVPMHTVSLIILFLPVAAGTFLWLNNPHHYTNWRMFFSGVILVLIAVTTELYLPIRSRSLMNQYRNPHIREQYLTGKNIAPRINECEPGENWTAFQGALHRSQYGPQRILPRQTQDATGYGVIAGYFWQMAMYVRYLSWQPIPENTSPAVRTLVLLAFYAAWLTGIWQLSRMDKKIFLFLMIILFMLSFAIVGYLNMKFSPSDTNPKHQPQEVRERDYFFHTGFAYIGIFSAFGFYALYEALKKATPKLRALPAGTLVLVVIFNLIPLAGNIRVNNRYGNFIPRDYGYNMLISCDDNSIVFTNGDNDTFPLWFVQEVLGFQRDVIVANLSLINTDWYIRQLKLWGAPISFSDYVIKRLQPVMAGNRFIMVKDIMIRELIAANAGIKLKDEDYFSTQEDFAAKYLKGYRGQRTIYFASTVSEENYKGFSPYLRLEGLVYRVIGDSVAPPHNINVARTQDFFYRVYRYTGIFNPDQYPVIARILQNFEKRQESGEFPARAVVKDDNTQRLYTNYAAGLFALGLVLRDRDDLPGTEDAWRFALAFKPQPDYPFLYNLGILYLQQGRPDSGLAYLSRINVNDPKIITQIGNTFGLVGEYDRAVEYLRKAIALNPRYAPAYSALVVVYLQQNKRIEAKSTLREWLTLNPYDSVAMNMLKEIEQP